MAKDIKQFKDDMSRDEQIRLLFKGASLFDCPIVRHKRPDEQAAYYSITYTRGDQEKQVLTRLFTGEDFEFMEGFLRAAGGTANG